MKKKINWKTWTTIGVIVVLVGMIIIGAKRADDIKEKAVNDLYGDEGLSDEQMDLLLGGLKDTADDIHSDFEDANKYLAESNGLQEQYDTQKREFVAKISSEDPTETSLLELLAEIIETCDEKLRTTTDAALAAYEKMFLENDGMISEEEQNVLNSMETNYSTKKESLIKIQSEITELI